MIDDTLRSSSPNWCSGKWNTKPTLEKVTFQANESAHENRSPPKAFSYICLLIFLLEISLLPQLIHVQNKGNNTERIYWSFPFPCFFCCLLFGSPSPLSFNSNSLNLSSLYVQGTACLFKLKEGWWRGEGANKSTIKKNGLFQFIFFSGNTFAR